MEKELTILHLVLAYEWFDKIARVGIFGVTHEFVNNNEVLK